METQNTAQAAQTFTRFDRHAIFSGKDRTLVLDLIDYAAYFGDRTLENKLFGLFDGYLYNDLLALAKVAFEADDVVSLENLINKIND